MSLCVTEGTVTRKGSVYAPRRHNGVWSIFHLWLVELAHVEMQGDICKVLGCCWVGLTDAATVRSCCSSSLTLGT